MAERRTDSGSDESSNQYNEDPLLLQGSDDPGMILVTSPLTEENYLNWSRSIKIALGVKLKLGFINGEYERLPAGSSKADQWERVDCMIRSLILNSILKEIVEGFIYTTTTRELWIELQERYGECNGPLLYQLQREIGSISQGNERLGKYFTRLKKLWDELTCLMPVLICTCGASKEVSNLASLNRLMQFLMGLNDSYDHVKNQILVMEPLPSVNKAYSMILSVEKQRDINNAFPKRNQNIAMNVRGSAARGRGSSRGRSGRRIGSSNKETQHCTYCNLDGHMQDSYFKLHGYLEWYKNLKEQRGRNGNYSKQFLVDCFVWQMCKP